MGSGVRIEQVSRSFGPTHALREVSLELTPGRIHGLLGPNGAGKTTLLRILLGLIRADSGELSIQGSSVSGFVEAPRFYPYLTGAANLELVAGLNQISPDRVLAALEAVGLSHADRRRRVSTYSLGMRQRLGIAAALLPEASIVVLDEPANGLDPAGQRDVRALVRSLATEQVSVLVSSHVMAEVEEVCDDVTVLHRGQVAFSGKLSELRKYAPLSRRVITTSDDDAAERLGNRREIALERDAQGQLSIRASQETVDKYVVALLRAGIIIRSLEIALAPLEAAFLTLTGEAS